ncbi:hypothetical protein O1L44_10875 [Streptomyces noursei]|nr:hypothetical protein [Streptomyces noursei]
MVASRALAELAARVRPLLIGATLLFAVAAGALTVGAQLLLARAGNPGGRCVVPAVVALAVLLFLARLLAVHGFPAAAAAGLGAAATLEAVALALVLTARLPGLARLGTRWRRWSPSPDRPRSRPSRARLPRWASSSAACGRSPAPVRTCPPTCPNSSAAHPLATPRRPTGHDRPLRPYGPSYPRTARRGAPMPPLRAPRPPCRGPHPPPGPRAQWRTPNPRPEPEEPARFPRSP